MSLADAERIERDAIADTERLAAEQGITDARMILVLRIAWCDGRLNGLAWGRELVEERQA